MKTRAKRVALKPLTFGINRVVIDSITHYPAEDKNTSGGSIYIRFSNGATDKIYSINRVYIDNKLVEKKEDPNNPAFANEEYYLSLKLQDLVSSYLTEDEWDDILEANNIGEDVEFDELAAIIVTAIKRSQTFINKKPINVFARYSTTIPEGINVAIVQIPKNGKDGQVYSKDIETESEWQPFFDPATGLKFFDNEDKEHPISRPPNYYYKFYTDPTVNE
tara:strand:+ start:122 stop:781 length:660 start_codon:yes stop_codon:yes gene_type:complete